MQQQEPKVFKPEVSDASQAQLTQLSPTTNMVSRQEKFELSVSSESDLKRHDESDFEQEEKQAADIDGAKQTTKATVDNGRCYLDVSCF